ncbi:MAG TPA: RNase adapter RapZ [Acetobacteraceae bacterium]|jgi:RNase adapter protein RapZ|nr:RNase adapter RapZ [Acetobacteraceae bacterium]
MTAEPAPSHLRVVLVTGLSGAGKGTILHALEDLGYEAVDNPPLPLLDSLVGRSDRPLAIGIDARTRGFDPAAILEALAALRRNPALAPSLVFAEADEPVLLRRYTESRRRHPLAPSGKIADGIAAERTATAPLRAAADLLVDTSETTPAALRRLIEGHFAAAADNGLAVALVSFSYAAGLPREADLVFDVRFLRNPHYVPELRPLTGRDLPVGAYIEADPDFPAFLAKLCDLLLMLLPRYRQEGKSYVTIAVGCTGGRHRSVHVAERISEVLGGAGWRVATAHRELPTRLPAENEAPESDPRRSDNPVMIDRQYP